MHNHLKALSCCFILLAGCSDDKKPTVSKNDHVNNVVDQLLSQKTAVKTTNAPAPVTPVGSRATVKKDPGKMTDAEYAKWRKSA